METFEYAETRIWRSRQWIAAYSAILFLICSVPASIAAEAEAPTYLNSAHLLQRALDAVFSDIGSTPRVSAIEIAADEVIVRTQGKKSKHHTDEWRVTRFEMLWLDWDLVDGPKPYISKGIVALEENSFFDVSGIAIADIAEISGRAIAKASMEEAPTVTSITINRYIRLLPERRYGAVRWSFSLTTGRESATVYANAAGQITAADLSQTIRSQRLDLLRQDDWPMADAQAELASVIGNGRIVHEVTVRTSSLSASVEKPGSSGQLVGYIWNYSGVRQSLGPKLNTQLIFGGTRSFRLSDLDFTALPKVKAAALAAIGVSSARIDYLVAKKRTTGAGKPEVMWRANVKLEGSGLDLGGKMTGEITLSTTGKVVRVVLPESIRPPENWLKPDGMLRAVERLQRDFGADTLFKRIFFKDDGASVMVEDPRNPGTLAQFSVRAAGETRRSGKVFAAFDRFDRELMFTLVEIAALTSDRLSDLRRRTLETMKLKGAEVFRWTVSKSEPANAGQGILAIEVRAGIDRGSIGGRVVYAMDGTVLDMVTP